MNKEFVTYEQALALKELGFNEPCFGYYLKDKNELNIGFIKEDRIYNDTSNGNCLIGYGKSLIFAPTFSQAFRWFRERYNLLSFIDGNRNDEYRYVIFEKTPLLSPKWFNTYEKAEQACLDKLIEIIKDGKREA